MREILFRGKRIDNGEWVYGDLRNYENNGSKAIFSHKALSRFVVVPETVGQYTGLTDKNGTKIFEGDILRFSYTGNTNGVEGIASVVFESGKFGVLCGWHKELVCLDGFANTKVEVIGNIHDNPELLGEEGAG